MRSVPPVNSVLEHPAVAPYESLVGRPALRAAVDAELDRVRAGATPLPLELIVERVVERIEAAASQALRAVINATGTILHTNLGRSPLAEAAFAYAWQIARGYSNLEFDVQAGERGSRYDRATALLCETTGAEDALVVNNCAAAVLLVLDTFARGAEVVVARNQLVEIGGGFRLPDVLARSGARLVEVGATNKVYVGDYAAALGPSTALLMRSHRSNFAIEGFVADVDAKALVALGRRAGVAVVEDLGTGALVDLSAYGLRRERTIADAIADGVDVVACSGDKLLGGPQAGIIVGRRSRVARLRTNPLVRALRVDKVTLAILAGTLAAYRSPETRAELPLFRMLGASLESLRARAVRIAEAVRNARAIDTQAYVGGGTMPDARLPSVGIEIVTPYAEDLTLRLRRWRTPVVARIDAGCVILDVRTIAPGEDREVIHALEALQA